MRPGGADPAGPLSFLQFACGESRQNNRHKKNHPRYGPGDGSGWRLHLVGGSGLGLLDFPRTDAAGADHAAPDGSFLHDANALQIREPASIAHIVGVTDVVSEHHTFVTDLTATCHDHSLLKPRTAVKLKNTNQKPEH